MAQYGCLTRIEMHKNYYIIKLITSQSEIKTPKFKNAQALLAFVKTINPELFL